MTRKPTLVSVAILMSVTVGVLEAASISVDSTADVIADDGNCTLREAVIAANTDQPSGVSSGECPAGGGSDVIEVPPGEYVFQIPGVGEEYSASGDLNIREDLTIRGMGPDPTTIDANNLDRVFWVWDSGLVLENLAIKGGATTGSGGAVHGRFSSVQLKSCLVSDNSSGSSGGAIAVEYQVSIQQSRIENNVSSHAGGAIYTAGIVHLTDTTIENNGAPEGGAIYSSGQLVVDRSSVLNNDSTGSGGGIYSWGETATVSDSTIARNFASDDGGGVFIGSRAAAEVFNTTISDNLVGGSGGGIFNEGDIVAKNVTFYGNSSSTPGSAISNEDTVAVFNTIIQGTCSISPLVSGDGNIESPGDSCGLGQPSDQTGVTLQSLNLGSLAYNGGGTMTHTPMLPSVAIDKAVNGKCLPKDQRGVNRPLDGDGNGSAVCDVGSVEASDHLFSDGFESGDTSAWSITVQ